MQLCKMCWHSARSADDSFGRNWRYLLQVPALAKVAPNKPFRMDLSEADIADHLRTLSFIPSFQSLVKSSEGGEHIVWVIDDAFILRIPVEGTNSLTLDKEKQLHDLLSKHTSAIPKCIHIGQINAHAYAIYEKVKGNSIESTPEKVNKTTEANLANLLLSLKQILPNQVTALGYSREGDIDLAQLQSQALSAWKKMTANQQIEDETDIDLLVCGHFLPSG